MVGPSMVNHFFFFFCNDFGSIWSHFGLQKKKYLKMTNIEEISFIVWKILLSFLDSIFLFAEYLKHQYLNDKIQVEWSYLKKNKSKNYDEYLNFSFLETFFSNRKILWLLSAQGTISLWGDTFYSFFQKLAIKYLSIRWKKGKKWTIFDFK